MIFLKRQLPIIIAFVAGIMMWIRYYIPSEVSTNLEDGYLEWVRIIVGFAAILGILSLLQHHMLKIRMKRPGFAFSYVTIAAFALMMFAGFAPFNFPGFAEKNMETGSLFNWLYEFTFIPMQATMFSVLAFFIASAAFRAFRARSMEATLLLVAAIIMMVGRVPIGDLISNATPTFMMFGNEYHFIDFEEWTGWLLNVPNAAAKRGILLGVYLSQIAISIRIIFGIERTYMGGGD
ncbi:hypothetical protein KDL44_02480 [bacterium]|nr:hypothetical protein [bacterium]